jgi:hypothetical protein
MLHKHSKFGPNRTVTKALYSWGRNCFSLSRHSLQGGGWNIKPYPPSTCSTATEILSNRYVKLGVLLLMPKEFSIRTWLAL